MRLARREFQLHRQNDRSQRIIPCPGRKLLLQAPPAVLPRPICQNVRVFHRSRKPSFPEKRGADRFPPQSPNRLPTPQNNSTISIPVARQESKSWNYFVGL